MKTITKFLATGITVVALLISANLQAQTVPSKKLTLSFGLDGGIPEGQAIKERSSFEVGATAVLQYGIMERFNFTFTSGYYNFVHKNNNSTSVGYDKSLGIMPVKVGLKAFFLPNAYVAADGGVGFEFQGGEKNKAIWSPSVGFANKNWDVGVRYENFSSTNGATFGVYALRVAYGFGI